ncbi:hypothetical protein [Roseateles sp.]|uniref:hypothetical protein n=1 Tax=Roseateles sp. TaxID=1971397 RepID=UPI0039E961A1
MFVVYGWLKERRPLSQLARCYCFVCQRHRQWVLLQETEWVTLFYMRTLPFRNKYSTVCEGCGDEIALSKPEARRLQASDAGEVSATLERSQLAGKNEVQRNFLIANRMVREQEHNGTSA